jgi:K+/H+ antiporter YhaU regulatory subunit KhtT
MDYELLLRIERGYCVSEYLADGSCSLVNKALRESRPWDHGVAVLAIRRNEEVLPGLPCATDIIQPNDIVTLYGEEHAIKRLLCGTDFQHKEANA